MLVSDCLVSWFYACCLVACFVDFGLLFLLRLFSWFLFSWLLVVELLHDNRRDNNNKTTLTIYKIIIMIAYINSTARTACANWNGECYSSVCWYWHFPMICKVARRFIGRFTSPTFTYPWTAESACAMAQVRICMMSENDVILFGWFLAVVDCFVERSC